jgi:apolipoprotein D and lipocalin family protein
VTGLINRARMILLACAVLGMAFGSGGAQSQEQARKTPLTTVERVDLERYAGRWFEIARYPNRFQKGCAADTTAEYSLREDGKIVVLNSCKQKNQKVKSARGTAQVVDKKSNAKLKVTFFWPFYGNYWIIDLEPQYRYAVVGEPDRKYLWILSRTPALDEQTYAEIIGRIRSAGYDPSRLVKTPQTTIKDPA